MLLPHHRRKRRQQYRLLLTNKRTPRLSACDVRSLFPAATLLRGEWEDHVLLPQFLCASTVGRAPHNHGLQRNCCCLSLGLQGVVHKSFMGGSRKWLGDGGAYSNSGAARISAGLGHPRSCFRGEPPPSPPWMDGWMEHLNTYVGIRIITIIQIRILFRWGLGS